MFLCNNPSTRCINIYHYDFFNQQADWPMEEQEKFSQERQNENDGLRKGRVKGIVSQSENKSDTQNGIEIKVTNLGEANRLMDLS